MRVILEIPEDALEKLGELAKLQKRSRKNFMEYILVNHTECAEYIAPESIAGILSQNKPVEGNVRQTKESVRNVQKNASDVKIQDLTNQSKTNYSVDTTRGLENTVNVPYEGDKIRVKPQRLPNEDAIDYAGRVNEWKQSLLK